MEEVDPETALTAVDSERERRRERAVDALEWFRDRAGLVPRSEAVPALAAAHDWSEAQANVAVGDVVGDLVDPVQQVVHPERGKLVGIVTCHEYPDSGAYAYVDYDDVEGRRKRAVCSQCVVEADSDAEVAHATEGEGSSPEAATWEQLRTIIEDHYDTAHDVEPSEVEVGASLASGTTISGNKAFHSGNDGVGSNLDADSLEGNEPEDLGGGSAFQSRFTLEIRKMTTGGTTSITRTAKPATTVSSFITGTGYALSASNPMYLTSFEFSLSINNNQIHSGSRVNTSVTRFYSANIVRTNYGQITTNDTITVYLANRDGGTAGGVHFRGRFGSI